MNLYAYCENGPVNAVDPDELQTIYLYNEYAEGVYTLYELTTGANGVDWDLAGIANILCVDPSQLEPAYFDGYGSGYVVRGGGGGSWDPAGKAGNRKDITLDGPLAYTPIDSGPLDGGSSSSAGPTDSTGPINGSFAPGIAIRFPPGSYGDRLMRFLCGDPCSSVKIGICPQPPRIHFGGHKSPGQWDSKMAQRGWTRPQIMEAVEKGQRVPAPNNVHPGNSATRYIHRETGRSAVIDDVTGEILHIGGDGFLY
jgi:hypothetical protein